MEFFLAGIFAFVTTNLPVSSDDDPEAASD
jgi:hypothetical protein